MTDLQALQREIAAVVGGPADPSALATASRHVVGDAARLERRLAIHRANVEASTTHALAAAYPVIEQLVGGDFFGGLARAFRRTHGSTSGDLADHGDGFARFLAGFEQVRDLPYLPDLADLEWAVHIAAAAEDAPPFDDALFAALATVSNTDPAVMRFIWAAGTAVVESVHPVARLWSVHQPGHDGAFDVDRSRAERAWVARVGLHVTVEAIGAGEARFIVRSLAGASFESALVAALDADPAFDAGRLLRHAIGSNRIIGLRLDAPHDPQGPESF